MKTEQKQLKKYIKRLVDTYNKYDQNNTDENTPLNFNTYIKTDQLVEFIKLNF